MSNFSVEYISSTGTGAHVTEDQFGANVLHTVNVNNDSGSYVPSEGFQESLQESDIVHLRYPGGHSENTIDITQMSNGEIRQEVREFLDWCVENSADGRPYAVTLTLPTKSDVSEEQIEEFVFAVLSEYGDTIVAIEVGNEYSIGVEVENPDRTKHPEEIEGSDFIPAMNEVEYGIAANKVINATQNAIDRLAEMHPTDYPDPLILIQMAETNGAASNYKGGEDAGNYDAANEAIVAMLDDRAIDAIDGAVVHYYYNVPRGDGKTFSDVEDWREIRRIDERYQNFMEHLGRDVELFVTEWNVVAGNHTQHGASGASVLLEMFEFMVRIEVDTAHIWPLQHLTPNNILGSRYSDEMEASMSGAAFIMMAETIRPRESSTGVVDVYESMMSEWAGTSGELEINHYSSDYQDVLFVSSRVEDISTVNLDLGGLLSTETEVSVQHLTIDPNSSDGLSDFADEDGKNRGPRRVIDQSELEQLRTLVFFDENDANHVKISDSGKILTYLPPFETIVPLVPNPESISDYYFTAEADVKPLIENFDLGNKVSGEVKLDLMPYDVAVIIVDKVLRTEGLDTDESLFGGIGRDFLLGRGGDDFITAGEGNDTLKGGWGDDTLVGGLGDDFLVDGVGGDVLVGNEGNDTSVSSGGEDLIETGDGDDVVELQSDGVFSNGYYATHSLSLESSLENWSVSLDGFNRYHVVTRGGSGEDKIFLGNGNDALFRDDVFSGVNVAAGGTHVERIEGIEVIKAGDGDDILDMTSSDFLADSGMELHGEAGDDTLWGGNGDDHLYGGEGNDVLAGGRGMDVLTGGSGADTFHFVEQSGDTQEITDFSRGEGDMMVLHLAGEQSPDDFIFDVDGTTLNVVGPDGSIALSVDVGTQAHELAQNGVGDAEWLEFM